MRSKNNKTNIKVVDVVDVLPMDTFYMILCISVKWTFSLSAAFDVTVADFKPHAFQGVLYQQRKCHRDDCECKQTAFSRHYRFTWLEDN